MEQHKELDLLLRYLRIINKYKWMVLFLVVIIALGSAYKESRRPVLYNAVVTTLHSGGGGGTFTGTYLEKLGISVSGAGGDSLPNLISAIIYSRRMAKDIVKEFGRAPVSILTYRSIEGVFSIRVTADDPQFAVNVANFCVANVDKINGDLDMSPAKPLLKVLDRAENASPISMPVAKKVAFQALFAGFLGCFLAVFIDYLRKIERIEKWIKQRISG